MKDMNNVFAVATKRNAGRSSPRGPPDAETRRKAPEAQQLEAEREEEQPEVLKAGLPPTKGATLPPTHTNTTKYIYSEPTHENNQPLLSQERASPRGR